MKLIADFRAYLEGLNLVAKEQIDVVTENIKLVPSGRIYSEGVKQSEIICYVNYTAEIEIERFKGSAFLLFACITAWLMDNDKERENLKLEDPSLEVFVEDDKTATIDISIDFSEAVIIKRDEAGKVNYGGEKWTITNDEFDIAETGTMNRENASADDLTDAIDKEREEQP